MNQSSNQDARWKQRFQDYVISLMQIEKLISRPKPLSKIENTTLIKSFEIAQQLALGILEDYLKEKQIQVGYVPKEIIQAARNAELIIEEQIWEDMLEARNNAAHIYDEELEQTMVQDILEKFYPAFQMLEQDFKERLQTKN